jgi:hypothetical protein
MLSLPLELHRPILSELASKRDLCAVARVSRAFQQEAGRLLYRRIKLDDSHQPTSKIVVLFKHLCRSPTLPLYIRSLSLTIYDTQGQEFYLIAILQLLSRTLQRMTRLRRLVLTLPVFFGASWIFDNCTFKLVVFKAIFSGLGLFRFLEKQDELRRVELWRGAGLFLQVANQYLPPTFLPNLTILKASSPDALCLLPGRPVTHLRLSDINWPSINSRLRLSSGPVQVLAMRLQGTADAANLKVLPELVPHLQVLHVVPLALQSEAVCVSICTALNQAY